MSTNFHTFTVKGKGEQPLIRNLQFYLDEIEIQGVTGFSVSADKDDPVCRVTLNFIAKVAIEDVEAKA